MGTKRKSEEKFHQQTDKSIEITYLR